ncbi:MAG: hypothetical protein QMD36_02000 [Candidatus Aenigmarchaeota archaeon]|nr:hypothetical protein [Candidatus Aenigmarchaeota archaeon]
MKNKSNELIKFVKTVIKVAKKSLPPYSCKFSNHIYTQYQHLSILSIKKRLRLKYREIVELLELMSEVRKILKLKRIPHFSAIQKFFARLG